MQKTEIIRNRFLSLLFLAFLEGDIISSILTAIKNNSMILSEQVYFPVICLKTMDKALYSII